MKTQTEKLAPVFTFAGFEFPKYAWTLPRGTVAERLKWAKARYCGPYYHAPKPGTRSTSFYLDSDFMPGLRWHYADDIADIGHTGWYTDEYGDGDTIRGIVMRLPHGRGFIAGWTMGQGMISTVDYDMYDDIEDAAHIADSMAENVADREREYRQEWQEAA